MQSFRNKEKTVAIALVLMLTMTFLPIVNAHTPAWTIPTYAYMSVSPSPVGVGQTVTIVMWLDKVPPTAQGAYGDRWHNFKVTITKPGGATTTLTVANSDPVGIAFTFYTPDVTGNYTLVFNFPGQTLTGENPPPGGFGGLSDPAYIGDYYQPSQSDPVTLTVQQQAVSGYTETPLPTGYWTRPINGMNRQWWQIGSNWLGGTSTPNNIQPDGQAPDSAHILWTKPLTFGGIVSGTYGDVAYYDGLSYEAYWSTPIIMQGRLYYNTPTPPQYGFQCVDLRTGELIWWHNGTGPSSGYQFGFAGQNYPMLSYGQLLDYESPNQHGVIPYLWSTYTVGFFQNYWSLYDPFTGNWICNIAGVPAGGEFFGASTTVFTKTGILIYDTTSWPGRLAVWNSTACIQNQSPPLYIAPNGYWMWRPPLAGTIPAVPYGYQANVTLPALPAGSSIIGCDYADGILLYATNTSMLGYAQLPTPNSMTFTGISMKPETLGTKLFEKAWPWPSGNVTLISGPVGQGVFTMYVKEKRQFYGFSLVNGTQLWGPTAPLGPWDVYAGSWVGGSIAYGNLYYAGYGGTLYCYDIKNGNLKWTYEAVAIPFESPYGNFYPLSVGTISDGKVYLYSSEHSPNKPEWRGSDVRCVNAYTGDEIWKIDCWANTGFGGGLAIADGVLVTSNSYDNQIYAFGKGPTATTITAPQTTVANGSSILIQGTITDQSAGAKGTPCMSDDVMTDWMKYIYMQQPCPATQAGVPVKLEAFGSDGSTYEIGTVTSDPYGNFMSAWTPTKPGLYSLMATFAGSKSYFSSYAATGLSVGPTTPVVTVPTPPTTQEISQSTMNSLQPILIGIIVAVIIAIVIGIVNLYMLRRRK